MIPHWKGYPYSEIPVADWEKAKIVFYEYAISVDPYPPEEKVKEFDSLIERLCSEGWDRGDIYAVIEDCLWEKDEEMTEFQSDVLGEYLTALCGHCHPSFIERLPCEVRSDIDIVDFARGMKWRKRGPKIS